MGIFQKLPETSRNFPSRFGEFFPKQKQRLTILPKLPEGGGLPLSLFPGRVGIAREVVVVFFYIYIKTLKAKKPPEALRGVSGSIRLSSITQPAR